MRMMKRRRRQNLMSVCALFIIAGGSIHLTSQITMQSSDMAYSSRRLLGEVVHDRLELLGYVLGLVSFVISWTSRFPAILKAYKGRRRGTVPTVVGALYALSGSLYSIAILVTDTSLAFVVKALPWIMAATCWGVLELLILVLSVTRGHSKYYQTVRPLSADAVALLSSGFRRGNLSGSVHSRNKSKSPSSIAPGATLPKRVDLGHYMDVNSQSVRKECLKEVRISFGGQSEKRPVVRIDEACSTLSSSDSSFSSDLEWDFEESNTTRWRNVTAQELESFPLQRWMVAMPGKTSILQGSNHCNSQNTHANQMVSS